VKLLELICNRCTVRKYKDKPIQKQFIDKIIDAGRWGPSVHGFQPWRFIVITNVSLIRGISNILLKKSSELGSGTDRFLSLTAKTIANAPVIILVYNTNILREVSLKLYKINRKYIKIAELSEFQAIAAAIQNMILLADSYGIGSCWNTMPLFCEKRINKLVGNNDQLIAILTLGYPAEKSKRTPRKSVDKIVHYMH
jgi:nitroreductase